MGNPFSWLWKEIRGNALWDTAKWLWAVGGGVVTTAVHAIWDAWRGHPNVDSLLIVLAMVVVFLATVAFVSKNQKRTDTQGPPQVRPSSTPQLPSLLSQLPPPSQKLTLEILEGFVAERRTSLVGYPEPWILLRVRVVNRSDPPVTIKNWSLGFNACNDSSLGTGIGYQNKILDGFTFQSTVSEPLVVITSKPVHSIDTKLDERLAKFPVTFGGQEEGYLLFKTYGTMHEYYRYSFRLSVTDALDGVSAVLKYPGDWLQPATFTWS